MDNKLHVDDRTEEILERYKLAGDRLKEIAEGELSDMDHALQLYFQRTAGFLSGCLGLYEKVSDGAFSRMTLEECREENLSYYRDILPEHYDTSFANPDYAVKTLGEDYGKLLCFLYTELRSLRVYAFGQDRYKMTILLELFLEIYGMFAGEKVTYKQLRETIYWFLYDYAEEFCAGRVRQRLDPDLRFAADIIMDSDLSDLRYLYRYGEYISEDEIKTAEYLNTLPEEEIDAIARTFTEGFRRGFVWKGVDLAGKSIVNIQYNLGFERIIRKVILQFEEMGLRSVIFRSAASTLNKNQNIKSGYQSISPNEQYEYDHRFDNALYLDKRMVDRKIDCMRKGFEAFREQAAGYAGPAVMEVFGREPFSPVRKETACHLSQRQQNLDVEYASLSSELTNQYINQDERSFSVIAYPTPAIGERFPEIFHEIEEVNNLDNDKYERIQQSIIDVLDKAKEVHVLGRDQNMTNITVALQPVEDVSRQTGFENCLADVNIPVGEVFTSPRLKGTNGLLHVSEVYLEGFCYKDLKIWVEDGIITDYSCGNFPDPEEGKALIEENILFNHATLPMGEFAIGTNTTAFVMANKYRIMDKLPILIAEKTGPHMAFGDTCYSHSESVRVYNPDGREMIAKENDYSRLRQESPMKAYFNCHTDITIPYGEIGMISAVMPDHYQVPIIVDGRFVLEGTMELNEAFAREEPGELSGPSTMEDQVGQLTAKDTGGQ